MVLGCRFAGLAEDMALAEDYLKYCTAYVLEHCALDLEFFEKFVEKDLRARLQNVVDEPFVRLTYTEAVEILTDPKTLKAAKFEVKPSWGMDLGSEHERWLTDTVYKKPVIVTNYPKAIKAFYMRVNEDGKTVQGMDILVPRIGEIIGGSVREERLEVLEARMEEMGVEKSALQWYLDLRRFGTVPHAGFGLGFERLVMYVTGVSNIRDVIPFPRFPGHADI
jgi:asparaginyl-tRNA synthetase